jgi:hypothetical protein
MAYISGKDTKKWAPYAGKNSYHADKAQLRHDLGTEGCKANLNAKYEGDWKEAKREGRCYATPINPAATTFTDKGGSRVKLRGRLSLLQRLRRLTRPAKPIITSQLCLGRVEPRRLAQSDGRPGRQYLR